jgi:hypothetical protein
VATGTESDAGGEEVEARGDGIPLAEAVGGPLGVAEATLPFIAFTVAWTASGRDVAFGAIVALAISATLTALRLLKGESTQFAISGLVGVALGAFVAARSGDASAFFLPGILINCGWFVAYVISIAIRRPLLGFFLSKLTGEGDAWYCDRDRRRAYSQASWIWVGLFAVRLLIQLPLYLTDAVAPLAAARVITGLPLFALGLWLTYALLRPMLEEVGGLRIRLPGGG